MWWHFNPFKLFRHWKGETYTGHILSIFFQTPGFVEHDHSTTYTPPCLKADPNERFIEIHINLLSPLHIQVHTSRTHNTTNLCGEKKK